METSKELQKTKLPTLSVNTGLFLLDIKRGERDRENMAQTVLHTFETFILPFSLQPSNTQTLILTFLCIIFTHFWCSKYTIYPFVLFCLSIFSKGPINIFWL